MQGLERLDGLGIACLVIAVIVVGTWLIVRRGLPNPESESDVFVSTFDLLRAKRDLWGSAQLAAFNGHREPYCSCLIDDDPEQPEDSERWDCPPVLVAVYFDKDCPVHGDGAVMRLATHRLKARHSRFGNTDASHEGGGSDRPF